MKELLWKLCFFSLISLLFMIGILSLWSMNNNHHQVGEEDFSFSRLAMERGIMTMRGKRRRQLISFHPVMDVGNSSWIPHRTIHGAILHSCQLLHSHLSHHLRHSAAIHPSPTPSSPCENNNNNNITITEITAQATRGFPVPFVFWPIVIGRACPIPLLAPSTTTHSWFLPHSHHSATPSTLNTAILPTIKQVEKGYGLSHLQIWLEFIFYDHDLLHAKQRTPPEYLTSTTWSSVSGTFESFENGTLLKNGIVFQEEDLIVIIEEDSLPGMSVTKDSLLIVEKELTELRENELLLLKSCPHHLHHHYHSVPHPSSVNSMESSQSPPPPVHRNTRRHNSSVVLSHGANHTTNSPHRLLSESTRSMHHPASSNFHQNNIPASPATLHHTGTEGSHVCFSSYVISRKLARILASSYDVCGKGFDQQMIHILHYIANASIVTSKSHLFSIY